MILIVLSGAYTRHTLKRLLSDVQKSVAKWRVNVNNIMCGISFVCSALPDLTEKGFCGISHAFSVTLNKVGEKFKQFTW
jgi:hypothetical protein